MSASLVIDSNVYDALVGSYGRDAVDRKASDLLVSAIQGKIEALARQILVCEEKYGSTFGDFQERWRAGAVPGAHSQEVEADFMDWEMLETEKKALLATLSRIRGGAGRDVADVR